MKTFIAALLTSSLISPAVAGDHEKMLLCAVTAETANAVMLARQAGVSMDMMMKIVASQGLHSTDAAYANKIVLDAYARKKEHTEEDQQRAIEAFESATYLQCARDLRAESK